MAGWRIGWVVAPAELIEHMGNLELCMNYGLPGFIQAAGLEAIAQYDAISSEMRAVYLARRNVAFAILSKAKNLRCLLPEAGMFLMLGVQDTGLKPIDFCWQLYEATGISLLDASAFGSCAAGWIRLGFVIEERALEDACTRIAEFAANLSTS